MAKTKSLTKPFLVGIVLVIIFLPPFVKYQRLRYKNRDLEAQIRFLKQESEKLEREKARLEKDITYIESRAREKIGVVRKGEIVLKESLPSKK